MTHLKTLSLIFLAAIIGLTAVIALSSAPAQAFLGTINWPKIEPDQAYKVEAYGTDVRVYEWQSQVTPGKACVMAFSNSGPVGLDCDPTPGNRSSSGKSGLSHQQN